MDYKLFRVVLTTIILGVAGGVFYYNQQTPVQEITLPDIVISK